MGLDEAERAERDQHGDKHVGRHQGNLNVALAHGMKLGLGAGVLEALGLLLGYLGRGHYYSLDSGEPGQGRYLKIREASQTCRISLWLFSAMPLEDSSQSGGSACG